MKTIEEVRQAKKELKDRLKELVCNFEKENGILVDYITIVTDIKDEKIGNCIHYRAIEKEISINIKI